MECLICLLGNSGNFRGFVVSIFLWKYKGDLQMKLFWIFEFFRLLHIKSLIFSILGYLSNILIMYFKCLWLKIYRNMTFYSAMKSREKIIYKKPPSWVKSYWSCFNRTEIDRLLLTLLPKCSHKTWSTLLFLIAQTFNRSQS